MPSQEEKRAELRRAALEYHEFPTPGKIAVVPTKQLVNQHDLALAYSPGVAAACEEIVADPANAFRYTSRGNLVAVVTNGTAVLGLGNIGPLAAKPVMEGKGVLFKKFAGIDVFDIELSCDSLDKLVDAIAALEPTFGGINLEDIKAPDCFYVERKLRERMKIPVFHDDQHGTAIVVGAGLLNALKVSGKNIKEVKLVTSGAGAAALACLGLLMKLGLPRENIWVTDLAGVVLEVGQRHSGRRRQPAMAAHDLGCEVSEVGQRPAVDQEILQVAGAGVRRATQDDHALVAAVEEGLHRIAAEIGVDRHRVGAVTIESLDDVVLRRAADVAALGVEDHRHAGMIRVDMLDQSRQRVFGAERGEVGDLRLEGANQIGGGVDDGATEFEHGIGVVAQRRREFRRFGVEADADEGIGIGPALAQRLHERHCRLRSCQFNPSPALPCRQGREQITSTP